MSQHLVRPPVQAGLLVGGSSDLGAAIFTALLPARGSHVVLAGRPSSRRSAVAAAMSADHQVHELDWDARDRARPSAVIDDAAVLCGRSLDLVVIAVGCLSGGLLDGEDADAAASCEDALTVNLVAPAGVLVASVEHLVPRGGRVVVVSSASATRPRQGIAAYSVAKQGLDQLARIAARRAGDVSIHVVRPGHVRTAMTRGLPQPPLTRDPEQVAEDVVAGIAAGRTIIWSPSTMATAMRVLRAVPRALLPKSLA
ncbi:MAG TPA: SDR family NAD(P)-dependent oxidoreductase [Actinomycetales bacterium]|nr:SDR family NAD(P)-dependent oxidoreductase [Actinomycetales bacterium]